MLFIASCDKKFNDVGSEVLPPSSYVGKRVYYPVGVSQTLLDVVQTNNTPVVQLGERQDRLYGNTSAAIVSQLSLSALSPNFGALSAQGEIDDSFDEQETVTDVWLEIPFFTNQTDADGDGLIDVYDIDDTDPNSDSDGDGASDSIERNNGTDPTNPDTDGDGILDGEDPETVHPNPDRMLYEIDSLFGDRSASFDVEVNKLNYFLRQLDPNQNFEQGQAYTTDFPIATYKEELLANQNITLDFNEIVRDDAANLSPRLRVPLSKEAFQRLILDKEGATAFSSVSDWRDYFRAISIETSNFSSPLLMLLDVNNMAIRMAYTYKGKKADTTPVEIEDVAAEFLISTAGAIRFNTLTKTTTADAALNSIVTASAPEQLALSGGLGSVATLKLFEDNETLEAIKGKSWLLNEANLTFYVDKEAVRAYDLSLPERLYVYNANTSEPLVDFSQDAAASNTLAKLLYGGFLLEDEDNDRQYYKVRITDHLQNIINNDAANVPLQVALTNVLPNQTLVPMAAVQNTEIGSVPTGTVAAPKSAVFVGPNPSNLDLADLKLRLEIFYTETNQ